MVKLIESYHHSAGCTALPDSPVDIIDVITVQLITSCPTSEISYMVYISRWKLNLSVTAKGVNNGKLIKARAFPRKEIKTPTTLLYETTSSLKCALRQSGCGPEAAGHTPEHLMYPGRSLMSCSNSSSSVYLAHSTVLI